jgi:hypothetical protein
MILSLFCFGSIASRNYSHVKGGTMLDKVGWLSRFFFFFVKGCNCLNFGEFQGAAFNFNKIGSCFGCRGEYSGYFLKGFLFLFF